VKAASCVACTSLSPADVTVLIIAESLTGGHHHHVMSCGQCGAEWFEDVVIGGFGMPIPSRRDTVLCPCPEDGRLIYTPSVMLVRTPERSCRCGPAELVARVRQRR
jgi:hypothetical protein